MIYATGGSKDMTRNVPVSQLDRQRFCLSDKDVLTLADYAIKIEKHYSEKAGVDRPMDMEWAKDGTRWQSLYGTGQAGNRGIAERGQHPAPVSSQGGR